MAESESEPFRTAMEKLRTVSTVSGNLRKDLKKLILEAMSDLTVSFKALREENSNLKRELNKSKVKELSYANVVKSTPGCQSSNPRTSFKAFIKTRNPERDASQLLRERVDPVSLGVGIKNFKKTYNGSILIETDSEDDLNKICQEVQTKCQEELETKIQTKQNPRLIIFNIPAEITLQNVKDIIMKQNPNLLTENSKFHPKFLGTTKLKKTRFITAEVDPSLRHKMLNCGLKLMWNICNVKDYMHIP